MCLIVDNSVRDRVFLKRDDRDFRALHACLFGTGPTGARIVYGGKLTHEYLGSEKVREKLADLDRAGRARKVDDNLVEQETAQLVARAQCRSNDEHIIALAKVGKVRLLCADDGDLKLDFKSKALIDKPRGKVYNRRRHDDLLRQSCGGPNRRGLRKRRK